MKIRNGFVSNSSSSSFVVVGRKLHSLEDVNKVLDKGRTVRIDTNRWGCDGLYFLDYHNNKNLLNEYFEKLVNFSRWSFWEVFYEQEDSVSLNQILDSLGDNREDLEGVEIFNINADYHEPYDMKGFILKEIGIDEG